MSLIFKQYVVAAAAGHVSTELEEEEDDDELLQHLVDVHFAWQSSLSSTQFAGKTVTLASL
jgi:hypothetical protein